MDVSGHARRLPFPPWRSPAHRRSIPEALTIHGSDVAFSMHDRCSKGNLQGHPSRLNQFPDIGGYIRWKRSSAGVEATVGVVFPLFEISMIRIPGSDGSWPDHMKPIHIAISNIAVPISEGSRSTKKTISVRSLSPSSNTQDQMGGW